MVNVIRCDESGGVSEGVAEAGGVTGSLVMTEIIIGSGVAMVLLKIILHLVYLALNTVYRKLKTKAAEMDKKGNVLGAFFHIKWSLNVLINFRQVYDVKYDNFGNEAYWMRSKFRVK